MGNLRFSLGPVQYDGESPAAFPLAAQVGLGVGTSLLALGVSIIVLMYRWVPRGVAASGGGELGQGWTCCLRRAESAGAVGQAVSVATARLCPYSATRP